MTSGQEQIRLFVAPGSSSLAPHVALIETGAAFEAVPVILAAGEQRKPAYLSINPAGRIPAMTVNGVLITEVIGTLTWIAQRYPDAALLPLDDVLLMGRAYATMSFYASTMAVALAQCLRTERFTRDESLWPQLKEDGATNFEAGFAGIENELRDEWILGDRYSVVDSYALVLWRWGQRLGLNAAAYPAWHAHAERMLARPAVKTVLNLETELAAGAQGNTPVATMN